MRKLFTRQPRAAIAKPDVDPHRSVREVDFDRVSAVPKLNPLFKRFANSVRPSRPADLPYLTREQREAKRAKEGRQRPKRQITTDMRRATLLGLQEPVYVFRPRPGGVVIERWGRAGYQGTVPNGVVAARRAKNRTASRSRRANRR